MERGTDEVGETKLTGSSIIRCEEETPRTEELRDYAGGLCPKIKEKNVQGNLQPRNN